MRSRTMSRLATMNDGAAKPQVHREREERKRFQAGGELTSSTNGIVLCVLGGHARA